MQLARIADHDVLATTFDQMKSSVTYGGDERLAPDFALDVSLGAADDSATLDSLGREHFV